MSNTSAFLRLSSESVTPAAIGAQRSHMVDVRDYGAVGDGVTDDTAFIQAAVAAAKAEKATIYLPAGSYIVHGTAMVLDWEGASVCGEGLGIGGTSITTTSTTDPIISVPGDYNAIRISRLKLVGPGRATSTSYGINLRGDLGGGSCIDMMTIDGVSIRGFHTGIYFRSVANSFVTTVTTVNCNIGIYSLGNSNSNTFQNCGFVIDNAGTTAGTIGIHISGDGGSSGGSGSSIISCDLGGPGLETCMKIGALNTSVIGCNFECYGIGIESTQSIAPPCFIGCGIAQFGVAANDRYSAVLATGATFSACRFAVTNLATGAGIRSNSAIHRNLFLHGCPDTKIDYYSSGVLKATAANAGPFPTEADPSGETAWAANHGAIWRRVFSASNDILNMSVRRASGTYAWADLLDWYFLKDTNGLPPWLGASNTFTGAIQRVTNAANPAISLTTAAYSGGASSAVFALPTATDAFATGVSSGDTLVGAKTGGALKFATASSGGQTVRLSIKSSGVLNATSAAIPNYADATAADAALASGDLYTTTAGGRVVYRKP